MDELTWSYKGEVGKPVVYFETQTDWNQTLHTKINECGAGFYKIPTKKKGSYANGADKILASNNLKEVFESLVYYNKRASILSGRFTVEFTSDSLNEIILIRTNDGFEKKIKVTK